MLARPVLALSLLLSPCVVATLIGAAPQISEAAPPTEAGAVGVINGVVKDSTTGTPIENAVVVLSCDCLDTQREVFTNARGIYSFRELPPGKYVIQVLAGKANVSKHIELPRGAKFRANFQVEPERDQVIEIVVEASPVVTNASAAMTMSMDEAKALPVGSSTSRDFTAVVDLAPTASRDAAGISLAGTTGVEARQPHAGVLTAGTLDDNRSGELQDFAATAQCPAELRDVGLGPRAEIVVVDRKGVPINDAQLRVSAARSQRQTEAVLRTGTDGRAVVNGSWDLGLSPTAAGQFVRVVARKGKAEATARVELGAGPTRIELPLTQSKADAAVLALDLVLVVDTTGSMGDELDWLSTELRSVVARALADHPNVDARLGVVAYRDLGDSYVTRRFELSSDHARFEAFMAQQTANGGGDTPEAVDAALLEAANFAWRHDRQAAKVALLVADAPPHAERIHASFEAASWLREAGVSIYPVASSGIDDAGELVFRSLAADTGAQYLFLTDDSGIGNPHKKPHAQDYSVELLGDALLRILAAELRGEPAALPGAKGKHRPTRAGFELGRSLFDDGGQRELLGGPKLEIGLF